MMNYTWDFSQSEMKNYSEWIVIHLSGAYTGDTENKSRFFSKNPAYRYTYRNCSFTPKSLTWISAKFRVILFKRASCMIVKSNDHDKNPEKVNELHKEMTTGNKLGLQYSFNLSSQESTIFVIIQPKIKFKKRSLLYTQPKGHHLTHGFKALLFIFIFLLSFQVVFWQD